MNERKEVVSTKIYELIKNIVKRDIENYAITVHDSNKKGEGYLGEICFVSLRNEINGEVIHLVIKQAFLDKNLRSTYPIRKYYLNEILFYNKIWPSFKRFQSDKGLLKPFNKIPNCLGTSSEFEHEKLALENLRYQNFQTYDKTKPFDDEHLTFILKEYGKFHAIPFAYKLLRPEEYQEMTKDIEDLFGNLAKVKLFYDYIIYVYKLSLESLDDQKDFKAIEKLNSMIENAAELFYNKSKYYGQYSIFLHGDCWSNNIMLKYNEQKKLCDLRLLDFQLSKIGTPVFDLSYFLYSGGSKECFDQLDHYLKIYHNSLLEALEDFGLNSKDVYPFEQLKMEWKEYCHTGFTMGLLLWRSKLVYEDSALDLTDMKDSEDFNKEYEGTKYDEEAFKLRSRELIIHMAKNEYM